jgi:hypothetical protein
MLSFSGISWNKRKASEFTALTMPSHWEGCESSSQPGDSVKALRARRLRRQAIAHIFKVGQEYETTRKASCAWFF